jgi:hypothetical protein
MHNLKEAAEAKINKKRAHSVHRLGLVWGKAGFKRLLERSF